MSDQEINKEQMPELPPTTERELESEAFYIGWQPKAPLSFAKHVKRVMLVLFPLAIAVGLLLSFNQKKFSTAAFEFGTLTEVKGIYYNTPVPLLKVFDEHKNSILVPLVGYGKHGAEGTMSDIEKQKSVSLNGKQITLKGTLLYSDGKVLLQIDSNDKPFVKVEQTSTEIYKPVKKELGVITVKGEVIDPKCYFGVMKPGEGKVHKDCAIRCILGGIPPVLHVKNKDGKSNYYFIAGANGEKMNEAVKNFVAEPVAITARAVQYDDWVILFTNESDIRTVSKRELVMPGIYTASCISTCIK